MQSLARAQTAYSAANNTIKTPRGIEYDAVARITRELQSAAKTRKTNFSRFAEALHRNNLLWSVLAVNVADEDNELPAQLRGQIFYLSEFSKRHSARVLASNADVTPLLQINTAILRGLSQEGSVS